MLLKGTVDGLAMVPLSQAIEVDRTRRLLDDLLQDSACPQILVQAGWTPIAAEPIPPPRDVPCTRCSATSPHCPRGSAHTSHRTAKQHHGQREVERQAHRKRERHPPEEPNIDESGHHPDCSHADQRGEGPDGGDPGRQTASDSPSRWRIDGRRSARPAASAQRRGAPGHEPSGRHEHHDSQQRPLAGERTVRDRIQVHTAPVLRLPTQVKRLTVLNRPASPQGAPRRPGR